MLQYIFLIFRHRYQVWLDDHDNVRRIWWGHEASSLTDYVGLCGSLSLSTSTLYPWTCKLVNLYYLVFACLIFWMTRVVFTHHGKPAQHWSSGSTWWAHRTDKRTLGSKGHEGQSQSSHHKSPCSKDASRKTIWRCTWKAHQSPEKIGLRSFPYSWIYKAGYHWGISPQWLRRKWCHLLNNLFLIPSQVMSLSAVTSLEDFNCLGFQVNNGYLIDEVLEIVVSEDFKNQHSCSFPSEAEITEFNWILQWHYAHVFGTTVSTLKCRFHSLAWIHLFQAEQVARNHQSPSESCSCLWPSWFRNLTFPFGRPARGSWSQMWASKPYK